jgi:hypothetical protein
LLQCAAFTAWATAIPHQTDWINLDQQGDSATFGGGFGINTCAFPKVRLND